jgi:hypothetical protein
MVIKEERRMKMSKNQVQITSLLFEILGSEVDEELERDILCFINEEIAVEENDLFGYFRKISVEDVLHWLEEYEENWNPASKIYEKVLDS